MICAEPTEMPFGVWICGAQGTVYRYGAGAMWPFATSLL